jgi:enoyl-CoA hydratase/carnithine racemase
LYAGVLRQFGGKDLELKVIRYQVEAGVAELRLFRPKRMNAWTGRMHTEYRYCLLQAAEDPAVGAIVVTGEGRGFCVGADAAALSGHVEKGGYDPGTPDPLAEPGFGTYDAFDANFAYHFGIHKPIIAAVNGPAAGVGLALACYADLRLACPGLNFSTAHGKLNFPAEFGLSWLLPRIVGLGRANDLLLSSRKFTSEEGLAMGLFNRLVDPEDLAAEAHGWARQLVETVSPRALAETKRQIYVDQHRDLRSAVEDSEALLEVMSREPDYKEGVSAFLEGRKPQWGPRG